MNTTSGNSFLKYLFVNLRAWAEMHAVQEILHTCDFPNGAEHVEFFWVQSFYFVIDISVNKNVSSERHKHKI